MKEFAGKKIQEKEEKTQKPLEKPLQDRINRFFYRWEQAVTLDDPSIMDKTSMGLISEEDKKQISSVDFPFQFFGVTKKAKALNERMKSLVTNIEEMKNNRWESIIQIQKLKEKEHKKNREYSRYDDYEDDRRKGGRRGRYHDDDEEPEDDEYVQVSKPAKGNKYNMQSLSKKTSAVEKKVDLEGLQKEIDAFFDAEKKTEASAPDEEFFTDNDNFEGVPFDKLVEMVLKNLFNCYKAAVPARAECVTYLMNQKGSNVKVLAEQIMAKAKDSWAWEDSVFIAEAMARVLLLLHVKYNLNIQATNWQWDNEYPEDHEYFYENVLKEVERIGNTSGNTDVSDLAKNMRSQNAHKKKK